MTRESILAALRSTALENGGRPLGARAFQNATSINRTNLWNAGFANYSDAVKAAGLTPNTLMAARDTDAMLASLATLTRLKLPDLSLIRVGLSETEPGRRCSGSCDCSPYRGKTRLHQS